MGKGRYVGQFAPEFSRLHEDGDLLWTVPPRIRNLVVILGPRFSGTSTALKYMASHHGYRIVRISRLVRERAKERSFPADRRRDYLEALGRLRLEKDDDAYAAKLALREIRRRQLERGIDTPQNIVIDGVQSLPEFELLSRMPGFRAIWLDPGAEARLENAMSSGIMEIARSEYPELPESKFDDVKFLEELDKDEYKGARGPYPNAQRGGLNAIREQYRLDFELVDDRALVNVRRKIDETLERAGGRLVSNIPEERWIAFGTEVKSELVRILGTEGAKATETAIDEVLSGDAEQADKAAKISRIFTDDPHLKGWAAEAHIEAQKNGYSYLIDIGADPGPGPSVPRWTCRPTSENGTYSWPEHLVGSNPEPCPRHGITYLVEPS